MTITIKQKQEGNYYAELRQVNRWGIDFLEVVLCWYGREINQNIYHLDEIKKASNCYYRYCAKARKEGQ